MPVLALIAALAMQAATADNSLDGVWRSPGGNSIMKIAPCGASPCGTIVWASDRAKKDSSKVTNQLVGTQLVTSLRQRKDGSWLGKLFIPDKNMRVTAKIRRTGPGFVSGVQWHPEFHRPGEDDLLDCSPLLDAFLDAAGR